jgi:thioredoxin reductase (NADPH)
MDDIIRVYGASWCPDCRRAKRFLGDQRVSFEWHDIEVDPDGVRIVQERNNGNNIIPTIVFPDGSHLAEPSNEELAEKIGLERMATSHGYDLIIIGGGPAGPRPRSTPLGEPADLVIDKEPRGQAASRNGSTTTRASRGSAAPAADRIVLQARRTAWMPGGLREVDHERRQEIDTKATGETACAPRHRRPARRTDDRRARREI